MDNQLHDQYTAQEMLQRQQIEGQQNMYAGQLQEQVAQAQAVLVNETNPNKVLWEIELSLRNMEELPNGELKRLGEPIMNEVGISRMRFIMRGIVNQNTILSYLQDERQINKLLIQKADNIVDDLTLNWRAYEIKDKVMLDHIVDSVIYPTFFALMRAYGKNEKNWLKGITVENISGGANRMASIPKSRGGFWERFKL